jgi:hypothetical protein
MKELVILLSIIALVIVCGFAVLYIILFLAITYMFIKVQLHEYNRFD